MCVCLKEIVSPSFTASRIMMIYYNQIMDITISWKESRRNWNGFRLCRVHCNGTSLYKWKCIIIVNHHIHVDKSWHNQPMIKIGQKLHTSKCILTWYEFVWKETWRNGRIAFSVKIRKWKIFSSRPIRLRRPLKLAKWNGRSL